MSNMTISPVSAMHFSLFLSTLIFVGTQEIFVDRLTGTNIRPTQGLPQAPLYELSPELPHLLKSKGIEFNVLPERENK